MLPVAEALVAGGILAIEITLTVPQALALIPAAERPQVTHQSGTRHLAAVEANYQRAGVDGTAVAFIADMAAQYAASDLVICRAGASTIAELAAAGVASVLVPLMASTTSHQRDNAQWMAQIGAAIHQPQKELNIDALASLIKTLTRERCLYMADVAYRHGKRDANEAIAQVLETLGNS